MRLAVFQIKGGVGKTVTSVNLAVSMAQTKRVLLIDLDGQYSATSFFVSTDFRAESTIYDVLFDEAPMESALLHLAPTLSIIPGDHRMSRGDRALPDLPASDLVLKRAFKTLESEFDVIIMDVPSGWGAIAANALMAATHYLIPINCEQTALDMALTTTGRAGQLFEAYDRESIPVAVLLTAYTETNNARDIASQCRTIWPGETLETQIRFTVQIPELAKDRKTVAQRKAATGREDYNALTTEIIQKWQPQKN